MTTERRTDAPVSLLPVAPGLDEPLEIIGACHDRIRAQCATLRRLVDHLERCGADAQARDAAAAVMRYFDEAAPHHHADEEEDLFPALLAAVEGDRLAELEVLLAALRADHEALARRWDGVRPMLAAVRDGAPVEELRETATVFAEAYERHAAREDGELLPLARQLIRAPVVAALSEAMTRRRRQR